MRRSRGRVSNSSISDSWPGGIPRLPGPSDHQHAADLQKRSHGRRWSLPPADGCEMADEGGEIRRGDGGRGTRFSRLCALTADWERETEREAKAI